MRHYYVNKAYRNAFLAGADFPSFSRLTLFAITTPNFIHPSIMAASVAHKNTNVSFAPRCIFSYIHHFWDPRSNIASSLLSIRLSRYYSTYTKPHNVITSTDYEILHNWLFRNSFENVTWAVSHEWRCIKATNPTKFILLFLSLPNLIRIIKLQSRGEHVKKR